MKIIDDPAQCTINDENYGAAKTAKTAKYDKIIDWQTCYNNFVWSSAIELTMSQQEEAKLLALLEQ